MADQIHNTVLTPASFIPLSSVSSRAFSRSGPAAQARVHQSPIAARNVIDIGDRGIGAMLRLLAVQPGDSLDLFHGQLALGIERRYLSALLADLGGELLRCPAIEISVNEPG